MAFQFLIDRFIVESEFELIITRNTHYYAVQCRSDSIFVVDFCYQLDYTVPKYYTLISLIQPYELVEPDKRGITISKYLNKDGE